MKPVDGPYKAEHSDDLGWYVRTPWIRYSGYGFGASAQQNASDIATALNAAYARGYADAYKPAMAALDALTQLRTTQEAAG